MVRSADYGRPGSRGAVREPRQLPGLTRAAVDTADDPWVWLGQVDVEMPNGARRIRLRSPPARAIRPADIAPLDGARVVVLHAPLGRYGWSSGRTYQHMTPTLTLDRFMEPAEAAGWLDRVVPARENDLMSISDKAGS